MAYSVKPAILFIDDEPHMIETYRDLYEEYFEMHTVDNVKDGLKILQEKEFVIVITDMQMPGLNGEDFLSIANERIRKPIKIILSAYVDDFFSDFFQTKYRPYAIVRKPLTNQREFLRVLQEAAREYEFRYGQSESDRTEASFLSSAEVLKRLGISKPTLYKYLRAGMPSQRIGGRRLFDWHAISQWVKNQPSHA